MNRPYPLMSRPWPWTPDTPRGFYNLGVVYHTLGNVRKTRANFRRVLDLAPGHPQAPALRSWLALNPR